MTEATAEQNKLFLEALFSELPQLKREASVSACQCIA